MEEKKNKKTFREKIKEKVAVTKKRLRCFIEEHPRICFWSLFGLAVAGSALGVISAEASQPSSGEIEDSDASNSASMSCPNCGHILIPDAPEGWFNCRFCGDRFFYDGTTLKSRDDLERSDNGQVCENCGVSLSGGEYTGAWEDGNNAYPYVRCRNCHHKNILWQFGDD